MFHLTGETVVITGAAGGIGKALLRTFSILGATVIACDLKPFDAQRFGATDSFAFDLTADVTLDQTVLNICKKYSPTIVVSNAGWSTADKLLTLNDQQIDDELNLNLRSTMRLTQAFLPFMRQNRRGGSFVYVSSINAISHYGNPVYSAAKAGLIAWMRAVSTEEGSNHIRANVVAPGSVWTKAWERRAEHSPDLMTNIKKLYPSGRLVSPYEVANAIVFLSSPLASGISGAVLPVDGGISSGSLPFVELIS